MSKKLGIILLSIFVLSLNLYSSNYNDLIKQLKAASGIEKIRIYDSLINFYANKNSDSAIIFYLQAIHYTKKLKIDTLTVNYYLIAPDFFSDFDTLNSFLDSAIYYAKRTGIDSIIGLAYETKADWYIKIGLYKKAILYLNEAIKYYKKNIKKAQIYNSLGVCYKKLGFYELAIKYYQLALKLLEQQKSKPLYIASTLNNLAQLHYLQKNYETALKYYYQIFKVVDSVHNPQLQTDIKARTNLSIAKVLNAMGRNQEAFKNVEKAKTLFTRIQSPFIIYAYLTAGQIYIDLGQYQKAISNLDSCINLAGNRISVLANAYRELAEAYLHKAENNNNKADYHKAISYAYKALDYIKQTHTIYSENKVYQILYKAYAALGNYRKAFTYALKYIKTNEIIFNQEKTRVIEEMEAKYQAEKKQQEIEKQKLIIEKQNIEMKRQRMQRNALIAIILLLAALAYITYRSYQQKKRDNLIIQQKNKELEQAYEEIRVQRDQLQEQKNKIEKMHIQLEDSIRYAKRIQTAAMPSPEQLAKLFDEYFVFFRPLQIVSGDFYWAKKISNRYIAFTVADCTGHGVPGAFVSMLGISLLNEIIQRREITKASDVLEELRKEIKSSLQQSTNFEDSKDGMDLALCIYDTQTHVLQFAGANNPMYLIRKGQLFEYKAVKNPVAIYIREKPFETHYINLEPGDTVYLSSDGFYDQPGGPDGRKFMRKNFKQLLLKIWDLPMDEQKQIIEMTFEEWKNGYKQIDDVCVMGVRFNF